MISFKCRNCGLTLSTSNDKAGKKGKCPGCGTINCIPSAGRKTPQRTKGGSDLHSDSSSTLSYENKTHVNEPEQAEDYSDVFSNLSRYEKRSLAVPKSPRESWGNLKKHRSVMDRVPRQLLIACTGILVLLILALCSWLMLRDTWEADHHNQIVALEKEAQDLYFDGHLEAAAKLYDELFSLVGNKQIVDPELRQVVRKAEKDAEYIKGILEEKKAKEFYQSNKVAILALISQGQSAFKVRRFEQAVSNYEDAIGLIQKSSNVVGELAKVLEQAKKGRQNAKHDWEQSVLSELRRIAEKAKLAFDNIKFDEAEKQYNRLIEFEQANSQIRTPAISEIATNARTFLAEIAEFKKRTPEKLYPKPHGYSIKKVLPLGLDGRYIHSASPNDRFLVIVASIRSARFIPTEQEYREIRKDGKISKFLRKRGFPPRDHILVYRPDRFIIILADGKICRPDFIAEIEPNKYTHNFFPMIQVIKVGKPLSDETVKFAVSSVLFREDCKSPLKIIRVGKPLSDETVKFAVSCVVSREDCKSPLKLQVDQDKPVPVPRKRVNIH